MRLLRRIAREQRGAIAITVGLLFPALLGFGVLAVDVGNWYVHKRELQTQADAAALAGAGSFKYPCDNSPISAAAESYAGKDHNVFGNVPAARTPSCSTNRTSRVRPSRATPASAGIRATTARWT